MLDFALEQAQDHRQWFVRVRQSAGDEWADLMAAADEYRSIRLFKSELAAASVARQARAHGYEAIVVEVEW